MFLSAIGSATVANSLYAKDRIVNLIIGIIQIPITITTPKIPTAFFKTTPHPKTVSTASPNILPTTGTAELTTVFAVFAVIPSTLLASVPSKETAPTKIVKTIPKAHIIPRF